MTTNTAGNLRMYYVGSETTYPIGGRFVPFAEMGNAPASMLSGFRMAMSIVTQSVTTCLGTVQFNQGNVGFNGIPFHVSGSLQTTGTGIPTVIPYYFNLSAEAGSAASFYLWDTTNQQVAQGGVLPLVLCTFAVGVRVD